MLPITDCEFPNTAAALVEMRDLLSQAYAAWGTYPGWTVARMQHWFHSHRAEEMRIHPDFWREHAHLWRGADTRLVGFVASESDGETYAVTRPGHRDLEAEMLAWHVRARHNAGEDAVIVHHCPDSDFERTLAEQGYAHEGEAARVYTYDLRAMDLLYELPYRFVVRGMTGDDDFARQAELTRAVFPGSAYTPEAHAVCERRQTTIQSSMWLWRPLTVNTSRSLARWSIDLTEWQASSRSGTRSGYRKLGLGRAVVFETFRRLLEAGVDRAIIVTGAEPYHANRFYEALGPTSVLAAAKWIATNGQSGNP